MLIYNLSAVSHRAHGYSILLSLQNLITFSHLDVVVVERLVGKVSDQKKIRLHRNVLLQADLQTMK